MPTDTRELEEMFLVTRAELENRIGALEADARTEPMRVNNTLQEAIDNLKIELDTFKAVLIADFNTYRTSLRLRKARHPGSAECQGRELYHEP